MTTDFQNARRLVRVAWTYKPGSRTRAACLAGARACLFLQAMSGPQRAAWVRWAR